MRIVVYAVVFTVGNLYWVYRDAVMWTLELENRPIIANILAPVFAIVPIAIILRVL